MNIGLVLSGGGIKGVAHIVAIKALGSMESTQLISQEVVPEL